MPDQFTETTTRGFGSRILGSVQGIFVGILMIVVAVGVLYWNEGRADQSLLAKTAAVVGPTAQPEVSLNGKLVSVTGGLSTDDQLTDGLYLPLQHAVAIDRMVEEYAWVEHAQSETVKNLGGSETTQTTYSYAKEWTGSAPWFECMASGKGSNHDASRFRLPPGIHYGAVVFTDLFMIPHPCFGIDRFSNGSQDT